MTEPILPSLKPIPMKDRLSVLFEEKGNLGVLYARFVIYQSALTGYLVMRGSGVRMTSPPAIAWQMRILSKGSL